MQRKRRRFDTTHDTATVGRRGFVEGSTVSSPHRTSRVLTVSAAVTLTTLLAGCAQPMAIRPLRCPVVECKGIRCQTPPPGAAYLSDDWRCVTTPRY